MRLRDVLRATTILLLLSAVVLSGCKESDPVHDRIDEIVAAVEDRDAEAVAASLASDFDGNGRMNRVQAQDELKRIFFGYREINVYLTDVEILGGRTNASATFVAELSGQPKSIGGLDQILPSSSTFSFRLRLRKEGDTWLVAAAEWEREKSTPLGLE